VATPDARHRRPLKFPSSLCTRHVCGDARSINAGLCFAFLQLVERGGGQDGFETIAAKLRTPARMRRTDQSAGRMIKRFYGAL
jgi:hypothetical protein